MTLLSLTQCCRLLAIDGKTLRHWLAQAQLRVQAHPRDGRIKGLSREDLLGLARAHHRRLADLPEERAAPVLLEAGQAPPSLALGELLQTLSQVPTQLAALQQQLTDLTHRLAQPAVAALPVQDGPARRAHPAPALSRSRPAASSATQPPKPPVHVLPRLEYAHEGHYVLICPTHGLLPFEPESPQWFAWLATQPSFRFVGKQGHLTAHHEVERVPQGAWRAHRKIRNHTYNLRLGPTQALTIAVLEQAAATLQAHLA